jgi:hypothetical protein
MSSFALGKNCRDVLFFKNYDNESVALEKMYLLQINGLKGSFPEQEVAL